MKRITPELREYRNALDDLSRAWKDPHYDRCGRCHAVSFMALLEGDSGDLQLATRMVSDHARSGEDYGAPNCDLEGCVFHEAIPFPVARRLLRIHRGDLGGRDSHGRKLGYFELEAGTVFVRCTRRKATVHIWIEPPPEGNHESHPLEALARGWDLHFKACREECLAKYREGRQLAEADLDLEPPKTWELRAPFAAKRGRS